MTRRSVTSWQTAEKYPSAFSFPCKRGSESLEDTMNSRIRGVIGLLQKSGKIGEERVQKLFLFDFDGVVVDSLDVYEGTVTRCLEKIGQTTVKNRADFLELFDDNFYQTLVKKGVDLEAFMAASADILAQGNYDEMKPFYPLLPVLAELSLKNILVIISSSDSRDIEGIMRRYHLNDHFQAILGSDVNFNKEEKIRYAMARFGMDSNHTYYVGDTTGDIKEAKLAGVKTIAVTWGWHTREQLAARKPDYLIDKPEDLLKT